MTKEEIEKLNEYQIKCYKCYCCGFSKNITFEICPDCGFIQRYKKHLE